jgi:bifunctional aspartokinase / homoserine dehydrogenase 1
MDVARKVVILARECGLEAELGDMEIASLVPSGLEGLASADDFMARLPEVRTHVLLSLCAPQAGLL